MAAQNDETPTEELIRQLVAAGELSDPHSFDIVTVCEQTPQKLHMTPQ